MTENILARIRVRETHGIRRFLYPLRVAVDLQAAASGSVPCPALRLTLEDGSDLPCHAVFAGKQTYLEFAMSLGPLAEQTAILKEGSELFALDDPLLLVQTEGGGLQSRQKQFAVAVTPEGALFDVVYDGARHLRGESAITRNGEAGCTASAPTYTGQSGPLAAQKIAKGAYKDDCGYHTNVSLTAVKSWATVTHTLETPQPMDTVTFTLPLALSGMATCDFGVGGGIYGKLQAGTVDAVVWQSEFGSSGGPVRWFVATNGRVDYVGEVATAEAYGAQRWLHVVDAHKALALAVTHVPHCCRTMTARLNANGSVDVSFVLGEGAQGAATFGICYHFLNAVPALAAATNPQSILLPPLVDVLQ